MPPRRRRAWIGFAPFSVLAILAVFVLDSPLAGIAAFAAMILFVVACVYALGGQDPDTVAGSGRTGLRGWLSGGF